HLPLVAIHPMAMPAAKWLEAVALQSPEKAWQFHDKLFQNQGQLSEDYFKKTAKELGVDVAKAAKDAESQAVADRIEADTKEAKT
ncbi:DsbA family protein, partial [Pseudomonas aeruginosa]|uniref:DsbA family protein n=1 Tax=Pseudomonas aeruginosa TaxID=287 RepID=UPI00288802D7